ncbi:MAG: hypothetical protein KJ000_21570 [Pirellulaceae bacterium]|nr:hypothetical protein [Pirellulaceae bacterium]
MDWSNLIPWAIFGGIAVLIVASMYFSYAQDRKRTGQWQQVADQLRVPFLGELNDLLSRFGGMRMFQRGSDRAFRNAIAGDLGPVRIALADFRYTTGSGKNRRTHRFTVCLVENDAIDVPACHLRPERRFLDALGSLFGGQDIDFADDDEFSRSFVLQGDSEPAIRELFDQDVRTWFCTNQRANLQFEARGNTLALHTGRLVPPEEAAQLLQFALEITKVLGGQKR